MIWKKIFKGKLAEFSLKWLSKWSKTSANGFWYGRLKGIATWIISKYYLQKNKYISNLNPVCFQFQKRVLLFHPVCIWNFINQVEYVSKKRIQFVSFLFLSDANTIYITIHGLSPSRVLSPSLCLQTSPWPHLWTLVPYQKVNGFS